MTDLRWWVELAPEGWDFGPDFDDIEVSPTEFHTMWQRFQDTGGLPAHTPSRKLCVRLQEALDQIEADGG
jgi:hypothetical protein